jgi:hypothetical protein
MGEEVNVSYVIGHSVLVILWWISLWFLAEEFILYLSQDKKHKKVAICIAIVIIIVFYCYSNKSFSLQM